MDEPVSFALAPSGPLDRVHRRLGLATPESPRVVRRAILTALLAWLPLLVASLLARDDGAHIAFSHDIAAHVRFLIVVPLLIIAEASIGPRTRLVVREFVISGLVGNEDMPRFRSLVERAQRMLSSTLAELMLVIATAGLAWISIRTLISEDSMFWFERVTDQGITFTPAGWWYAVVATPIAGFLFLRWLWRYAVWTWFLQRVSRLQLHLIATHPDHSGGLGFVTFHQAVFASITLASGCGVAGAAATRILNSGTSLMEHKVVILVFMIAAIIVGLLPLLTFTRPLVQLKHRGVFEYGRLATGYVQSFEKKWLGEKVPQDEVLLGSGDVQSLADIGPSFERVSGMIPVLVDRRIILAFALAAVAPMLPLLLTVMPLNELAKVLLKVLV